MLLREVEPRRTHPLIITGAIAVLSFLAAVTFAAVFFSLAGSG